MPARPPVLELVDRIRIVEARLARQALAEAATEFLHGHSHQLGNALQIVDLASHELARRTPVEAELVADIRTASADASGALAAMIAIARPPRRAGSGAPVADTVRAAVALARPALAETTLELAVEIADTVRSQLFADEIEALVLAALVDAITATRLELLLREREVAGARWIELVRIDDRPGPHALAKAPSLLAVVEALARLVEGEVSLAAGRIGHELAIALPVAT